MRRGFIVILAILGWLTATGVVHAQPKKPQSLEGWGQITDPDGDTRIETGKGNVTFTVRGKDHGGDLFKRRAPRILREIEGDFTIQVKVSGDFDPGLEPALAGTVAFNGAGLLIWESEDNYLRLERNRFYTPQGQAVEFPPLLEHWKDSKAAFFLGGTRAPYFKGRSTHLRLQRRGDLVQAAVSHDGVDWQDVKTLSPGFARKVSVGVAAVNTASKPFVVSFADLRLTKGKEEKQVAKEAPKAPTLPIPIISSALTTELEEFRAAGKEEAVKEADPGQLPAQIELPALRKVKQATVYLRVKLPNGDIAEGTGFFAVERGIIVTNAHVLGMLRPDSPTPTGVDVVLHSGEDDEAKRTARVLGVDRARDLAVLKIEGDVTGLPAPLTVASAGKLYETQKVYAFGFPFGASLGKNITVSQTSVSSLRRDKRVLTQVQVNGGLHPGNSGGPLTDTRGVVVGVAVSIIHGTQIHFAIPGHFVQKALAGRFASCAVGAAFRSGKDVLLPLRVTCLDPLAQVREVQLEMWLGEPGKARPTGDLAARPGDEPRKTLPMKASDDTHSLDLVLPKAQAGKVCWLQPVLVSRTGTRLAGPALPASLADIAVLERKPAMLRFKAPSGPIEQTLKLDLVYSLNIFKAKESVLIREKMSAKALESLQPDHRGLGTFIRLTLGDCPYTRETSAKGRNFSHTQSEGVLSLFSPTFLVDNDHACKERGRRTFEAVQPALRNQIENMYEMICNTFEATVLPLPNRTLEPMETWTAQVPILMLIEGRREVQDIHLTCTYEGLRVSPRVSEAYVKLHGVVKTRGPRAMVVGQAAGHAHFSVDKGMVSFVKLAVQTELTTDQPGVRVLVSDEFTLLRGEGNAFGIKPATANQP